MPPALATLLLLFRKIFLIFLCGGVCRCLAARNAPWMAQRNMMFPHWATQLLFDDTLLVVDCRGWEACLAAFFLACGLVYYYNHYQYRAAPHRVTCVSSPKNNNIFLMDTRAQEALLWMVVYCRQEQQRQQRAPAPAEFVANRWSHHQRRLADRQVTAHAAGSRPYR